MALAMAGGFCRNKGNFPLGYTVYRMYFTKNEKTLENPFICTQNSIENKYIKIVFDEKSGELICAYDKKNGKELLSGGTKTFFVDETPCDTWAHGIKEFRNVDGIFEEGGIKLTESGPVRATVRSEMKLFGTTVIRDYSLYANSEVITVDTKIDFHEKHKILKFSVPVNTHEEKAYAKIPFGYTKRPADGSEQPCGEWIAMDGTNGGIGIATTSKYSFDAFENILTLTILRGAIYADHYGVRDEFCEYMEQGIHRFKYCIFPFKSFSDCEIKAMELNNSPTVITETFYKGSLPLEFSGISISKTNIIPTALKKNEDGNGYILRLYEAENTDTDVCINIFGTNINTHFSHNQIKTFLIENGNVKETDFMEWEV